jgi:hypothetical protein
VVVQVSILIMFADVGLQAAVSAVVDGLFSVLATLGVVPIIRCPKVGCADLMLDYLRGYSVLLNSDSDAHATCSYSSCTA